MRRWQVSLIVKLCFIWTNPSNTLININKLIGELIITLTFTCFIRFFSLIGRYFYKVCIDPGGEVDVEHMME